MSAPESFNAVGYDADGFGGAWRVEWMFPGGGRVHGHYWASSTARRHSPAEGAGQFLVVGARFDDPAEAIRWVMMVHAVSSAALYPNLSDARAFLGGT